MEKYLTREKQNAAESSDSADAFPATAKLKMTEYERQQNQSHSDKIQDLSC